MFKIIFVAVCIALVAGQPVDNEHLQADILQEPAAVLRTSEQGINRDDLRTPTELGTDEMVVTDEKTDSLTPAESRGWGWGGYGYGRRYYGGGWGWNYPSYRTHWSPSYYNNYWW